LDARKGLEFVIKLYFDGLCEPKNPGGVATYGYVVYRDGKKVHEGRGLAGQPFSPEATNNVAEYTAIIKGLEYLADQKVAEPVLVRGDSKLVIEQSAGRWKVKSPNIAPLNARVRELFFKFPSLTFEWVPREQNREADALTNLAYAEFQKSRR
jgi:ribonuclease HI